MPLEDHWAAVSSGIRSRSGSCLLSSLLSNIHTYLLVASARFRDVALRALGLEDLRACKADCKMGQGELEVLGDWGRW